MGTVRCHPVRRRQDCDLGFGLVRLSVLAVPYNIHRSIVWTPTAVSSATSRDCSARSPVLTLNSCFTYRRLVISLKTLTTIEYCIKTATCGAGLMIRTWAMSPRTDGIPANSLCNDFTSMSVQDTIAALPNLHPLALFSMPCAYIIGRMKSLVRLTLVLVFGRSPGPAESFRGHSVVRGVSADAPTFYPTATKTVLHR